MKKGLLSIWLAAVLVAGVFTASPAAAQATEGPFACGELFTDAAEDVDEENLDFIAGGIAAVDDSSFTAEMQVRNLTTDLPSDATGLVWYFQWTYGDTNYFASATVSLYSAEIAYSLGERTDTGFSTTASTEGTFNEGEEGTITVVVPYGEVGSPASGDVLTQIFAESRVRLSGPAGPGLVSLVDRAPDGDAFGSDLTVGTCGSESVDDDVVKEKELTKKQCKKIKSKKKRQDCLEELKDKNKKPPVEACEAFVPSEDGVDAETAVVTDEHTAEAPLEITITHAGPPDSFGESFWHNIQVDSEAPETGLYISYNFAPYEDHDLYLDHPDGTRAAQAAGFNPAPFVPGETDGTGNGGHSEMGAELIDGLRTADCAGYTTDFQGFMTEGGDYTAQLWLGEIQNDPAPPGA